MIDSMIIDLIWYISKIVIRSPRKENTQLPEKNDVKFPNRLLTVLPQRLFVKNGKDKSKENYTFESCFQSEPIIEQNISNELTDWISTEVKSIEDRLDEETSNPIKTFYFHDIVDTNSNIERRKFWMFDLTIKTIKNDFLINSDEIKTELPKQKIEICARVPDVVIPETAIKEKESIPAESPENSGSSNKQDGISPVMAFFQEDEIGVPEIPSTSYLCSIHSESRVPGLIHKEEDESKSQPITFPKTVICDEYPEKKGKIEVKLNRTFHPNFTKLEIISKSSQKEGKQVKFNDDEKLKTLDPEIVKIPKFQNIRNEKNNTKKFEMPNSPSKLEEKNIIDDCEPFLISIEDDGDDDFLDQEFCTPKRKRKELKEFLERLKINQQSFQYDDLEFHQIRNKFNQASEKIKDGITRLDIKKQELLISPTTSPSPSPQKKQHV